MMRLLSLAAAVFMWHCMTTAFDQHRDILAVFFAIGFLSAASQACEKSS
jgi:hypothetical protein